MRINDDAAYMQPSRGRIPASGKRQREPEPQVSKWKGRVSKPGTTPAWSKSQEAFSMTSEEGSQAFYRGTDTSTLTDDKGIRWMSIDGAWWAWSQDQRRWFLQRNANPTGEVSARRTRFPEF